MSFRRQNHAKPLLPLALAAACVLAPVAQADNIFAPTNPILGGAVSSGFFTVGTVGTAGNTNNWPGAETPNLAIDGTVSKYLNFAKLNTGFLVNPAFNAGTGSVVTSLQIWTANDAQERDPASYIIYGTNTALDFTGATTSFNMTGFTQVASGSLSLPAGRNTANPLDATKSVTVNFANTLAYKEYLIIFPTVFNAGTANSMQVGEVQLFGTAPVASLTWTGANATNPSFWDVTTTPNWSISGSPATFANGSTVLFDDTATGTTDITVKASVAPASMTFQNAAKNYTFSGSTVTSAGALVFAGTGMVTLNNQNNFTAGTVVNSGTVKLDTLGSLGLNPLSINNGNAGSATAVTVNFVGAQSIGSLSGTVGTASSGTNSATLNLGGLLTVVQTQNTTFAGNITGSGGTVGLTKNGNGTLTLSGINTYAGPTIVNGGTLATATPNDLAQGALPALQPVTVNSGATLFFSADDGLGYHEGRAGLLTVNSGTVSSAANTHSTLPAVQLNAATLTAQGQGNVSAGSAVNYILDGNVTTTAASTASTISVPAIRLRNDPLNTGTGSAVVFNVPRGTAPVDLVVNASIQDTGAGLTKSGNGIMSLETASTYVGATTINAGTVIVKDSAAFGSSEVTINGGTIQFASQSVSGFAGFAKNNGATVDAANAVATLTDNGGSEARTVFSPVKISAGDGFAANFTYTAGGSLGADGVAFVVQGVGPNAVGGAGGALGYGGIGSSAALQLNIYNPNTPGTAYNTGGNVTSPFISSNPVALGSGHPIAVNVVYDATAHTLTETLTDQTTLAVYTNTFTGVDIGAAVGNSSGYVGFTGGTGGLVATQTISGFTYASGGSVAMTNSLVVPAAATVGWDVLPTALNTSGKVKLQGQLTINAGSTINITGGSTATNLDYSITETNITTLTGDATVNVANNGTGTGNFTLGDLFDLGTNAAVTKTGAGTLTYAGNTNYTGNTRVNAGKLVINGTLTGSVTTVNSGGTLGGTGTADVVTVATGGTLAPGNGIGTLSTGALTFQVGSNFSIEAGTSSADKVVIPLGNATLMGATNLVVTLTADPTDNQTFTIVDGSAPLSLGAARFSFNGTPLNQGDTFVVNSNGFIQGFSISYSADSGNDVTLTTLTVPEPGTAAVLLAGLGCLLGRRKRRGV